MKITKAAVLKQIRNNTVEHFYVNSRVFITDRAVAVYKYRRQKNKLLDCWLISVPDLGDNFVCYSLYTINWLILRLRLNESTTVKRSQIDINLATKWDYETSRPVEFLVGEDFYACLPPNNRKGNLVSLLLNGVSFRITLQQYEAFKVDVLNSIENPIQKHFIEFYEQVIKKYS